MLRMTPPRLGALLMVSAYGNTGFLGYPITMALLPHMLTAAVLIDQIGMSIILYPSAPIIGSFFGVSQKEQSLLANKESQHTPHVKAKTTAPPSHAKGFRPSERTRNALAFFKSPLFIAMTIGGLVHVIPWPHAITHSSQLKPIGKVVMDCLGLLGQGTIPLIMLSMGASLKPRSAKNAISPILLASCLKLLLAPLAMLVFLKALGVTGAILAVGVLQAGMPTSVMSSVLTRYHDMDGDFAVGVVFITTVLSALTIPMWITLIGH
jgi:predicted permease